MTVTTPDRKTALVVVDLQEDVVGMPPADPMAGVATGIGVKSTARHGYELGFNVAQIDRA